MLEIKHRDLKKIFPKLISGCSTSQLNYKFKCQLDNCSRLKELSHSRQWCADVGFQWFSVDFIVTVSISVKTNCHPSSMLTHKHTQTGRYLWKWTLWNLCLLVIACDCHSKWPGSVCLTWESKATLFALRLPTSLLAQLPISLKLHLITCDTKCRRMSMLKLEISQITLLKLN